MSADDRRRWLLHRRGGIGASDVAGILGLSPWASPWSVWASKVGLADDDHDTESMEFGRRAEAMVGPWFTDITGLHLVGEQTWCSHPEHPWRRCTVDGFVTDGRHELAHPTDALSVGEIKTTSEAPKAWEAGPPVHYECQAAWSCHVTGIPTVHFIVLHLAFGRPQLRVYEYTPSLDDIATVVERVDRFWRDHVLTGDPPPVDDHRATTAALDHAWNDPAAEPVVDLTDIADLVREYDAAKRHAKVEERRAEAIGNELKARLAGHTEGAIDDRLAVSWREQTRTGIDAKAVRAAHGDRFDTHSTFRVLRTHLPETDHTKETTS